MGINAEVSATTTLCRLLTEPAGRRLRAFRLLASNEINPKQLTPHRDFDLSDCFSESIFLVPGLL
jgi:hypothetical protein